MKMQLVCECADRLREIYDPSTVLVMQLALHVMCHVPRISTVLKKKTHITQVPRLLNFTK